MNAGGQLWWPWALKVIITDLVPHLYAYYFWTFSSSVWFMLILAIPDPGHQCDPECP